MLETFRDKTHLRKKWLHGVRALVIQRLNGLKHAFAQFIVLGLELVDQNRHAGTNVGLNLCVDGTAA